MLVDVSAIAPESVERTSICIIGAGPAGIALADRLGKLGHRVALLEAGGFEFINEVQDVYKGRVVGDRYYDLDVTRLRMFGGSVNHWGGWTRRLEPEDMTAHGVDTVDWPIGIEDLDPYLAPACAFLEIESGFDSEPIVPGLRRLTFRWSRAPISETYAKLFSESQLISLYLHSAVTDVEITNDRIHRARVTRLDGTSFFVEADYFVMAMGGIETPRMLRWFNEQSNGALVADGDRIGRYWIEHPHGQLGDALMPAATEPLPEGDEAFVFGLTPEERAKTGVLNANLVGLPVNRSGTKGLIRDLACIAPDLASYAVELMARNLVCGFKLITEWEQAPKWQNRVVLDETEKDAFGVPRTVLHWERGEEERQTIVKTVTRASELLAEHDVGRVRLADWIVNDEPMPEWDFIAGHHHMGGTPMSSSPQDGIVDPSLKLHRIDNLYVSSASVFPSGGANNPTITIVQLSLRLADELDRRLAS
ncbi:MAG: GMC family oxidoreductase [Pseudomonadota bacterium]